MNLSYKQMQNLKEQLARLQQHCLPTLALVLELISAQLFTVTKTKR